jgi:transcriptional regulator with XRE-family HTH domain
MELRIKEVLKEKGLTSVWLASQIGITQPNTSNIVSGKSNPSLETLEKIANALDVSISALFSEKEPIVGVLIFNCKTYRIDSFSTLNAFFRDYADYLNLGKEEKE